MSKAPTTTARQPAVAQPVQYRADGAVSAAMITAVISDDVVNLIVFPDGAQPMPVRQVPRRGSFTPLKGLNPPTWWPA